MPSQREYSDAIDRTLAAYEKRLAEEAIAPDLEDCAASEESRQVSKGIAPRRKETHHEEAGVKTAHEPE